MDKSLAVCSWNANSITNKIGELTEFLIRTGIHICLLNETKLANNLKFSIKGFHCLRKDSSRAEGGVAVLIKNNIPYEKITLDPDLDLDCICIRLKDNTHIIATYNKPRNRLTNADFDILTRTSRKVLVVGDLNCRHTSWNCHRNNTNGRTLYNYSLNNDVTIQFPDRHTHFPPNNTTPTTIDLVLNKNVTNISDIETLDELSSDHSPIVFTLRGLNESIQVKTVIDHVNTDWTRFKTELDRHVNITNNINTTDRLEQEINKLTTAIQKTIKKTVTLKNIRPFHSDIPQQAKDLIKERNRNRKRWQNSRTQHYKDLMTQQTKQIRQLIWTHKNEKWTQKLESLQTKDNSLWKTVKALKNKHEPTPALKHSNTTALTDLEKAEMLADQFEQVHKIDGDKDTPEQQTIKRTVQTLLTDDVTDHEQIRKQLTNPTEIHNIIKTLNPHKAPGDDEIPNTVLKRLSKKTKVQLMYIINAIIQLQHFPVAWKTAKVIPVHKAGKSPAKPSSYRPISLLNTLSKITEKILLTRLQKHIRKNRLLNDAQFGFRQKHSTTLQVTRIAKDISLNFNKNNVTALTLLDIQKAFDKVWTDGLLYKLIQLKFPATTTKLMHSYLTDRTFYVKQKADSSTPRSIAAGVPQGSILGPILFILFINDIPSHPNTNTALFADDTAIYSHSFSAITAHKKIEIHTQILEKYFDHWKIQINPEKTETITFTKKFTNTKIFQLPKIYNQQITPKTSVKYLGVHLDTRLNYQTHTKNTITKASNALKQLYPLLSKNSRLSTANKTLIYKTMLRPILTYAAPVWCGASAPCIKKLQVFQNKCLRLALNKDRYTRIVDLHEQSGVQTVAAYVKEISENFYATQADRNNNNPLVRNITDIRQDNAPCLLKHKLPYQTLDVFTAPA